MRREKERGKECVSMREREGKILCLCVCVCVREREREREREKMEVQCDKIKIVKRASHDFEHLCLKKMGWKN